MTKVWPHLYRVVLAHGVRNLLSPGLEPRASPFLRQEHTDETWRWAIRRRLCGYEMDERDATLDEYNAITGYPCPWLIPIFLNPIGLTPPRAHRPTMVTRHNQPASSFLPPLLKVFSDFLGPVLSGLAQSHCALRPAA